MKLLITTAGDNIAPRLDTTREILIVNTKAGEIIDEPRTILLDKSSAEEICSFIIRENISCIICGGIEDKHYKYLKWKKIQIMDSVIGLHREALQLLLRNQLKRSSILNGAHDM